MIHLTAYPDGSCYHKSKLGGVGVVIVDDFGKENYISEGYSNTTISRMELTALLYTIKSINKNVCVELDVYHDSEYVVKSFTEKRLSKWEMIGWNNIKNVDIWKNILNEIKLHPLLKINYHHIRGHQKNYSDVHVFFNNIADILANYRNFKIYKQDINE